MDPCCGYQHAIADLHAREYPTLKGATSTLVLPPQPDTKLILIAGITYLDHAGTTPYPASLIQRFAADLTSHLLGNPHSSSPSSERTTRRVEQVRSRILSFVRADPEHFDVVFTANATAAIKLVVDAFRDVGPPGFWYGYHRDAHTSLVGVRQLATRARCFESDQEVEDWLADDTGVLEQREDGSTRPIGLFAYPAQSNMNGHRLPMSWPGLVRRSSLTGHQEVYTLVDAAAYAMTAQLDLSNAQSAPDFTALSFYKIFGFPDLGALLVRKGAGDVLRRRRYFGGGTVDMVTVMKDPWVARKDQTIHEGLEDGTLPFHHIIALDTALDVHTELYGSMTNVSRYTTTLAADLAKRLAFLRHANGQVVCEIYKDDHAQYGDSKTQGPTIAFNLRNAHGGWIGKSDVERLAVIRNIHLRTGGVCNPGGVATSCHLAYWEMRRNFCEGLRCGDDLDLLGGKPTGVVRVSLGAMSSKEDVATLINFIEEMFVETEVMTIPAQMARPFGEVQAEEAVIHSLRIFPVLGCLSWQVPQHARWPIKETGLAWDNEWCLVLQGGRRPLDPMAHPRMTNIRPYLDVEGGTLKLVATTMEHVELMISLWDSPPYTDQPTSDSSYRPLDPYQSEAISNFCTTVLGVPSTLARFRDPKRVAKLQEHNAEPRAVLRRDSPAYLLLSHERSLTITALREQELCVNVTMSKPYQRLSFRYIRLGQHYFEVCHSRERDIPIGTDRLLHLRNKYDRSCTAQNLTIQTGDEIQTFPADGDIHDHGLRACIASTKAREHICPVWNCRKDFRLLEELEQHLHVHKSSIKSMKNGDVIVRALAIPDNDGLLPNGNLPGDSSLAKIQKSHERKWSLRAIIRSRRTTT